MTSFPIPHNYADHVLVHSRSKLDRERARASVRPPARRFEEASGGAEALSHLESGFWQVVFLDRRLPDLDAEELSETVRQRYPGIEVVLLDSESEVEARAGEERRGAEMLPALSQVKDKDKKDENKNTNPDPREDKLLPPARAPHSILGAPLPGMIGNSRIMQPVHHLARLLAPRNTTVLITGPTGCGKEIVARAIHQLSPRAARTFAVVNCAAIPETLLEAELFGYARGAFTGAMQSYAGRIQTAQGRTLFLDEIGEMPLSLQPKVLRFLEQKVLQRLGSAEVVRVDARIISATNAHLLSLVREGKFREDLYYRLCGFPIEIPSLRDRYEDIVQLAAHFIGKYSERRPAPQLTVRALQVLRVQSWA